MDASRRDAPLQRIEPDTSRAPGQIRGRLLNELCTHALETLPEECCGLLTGRIEHESDRYLHAHRCRNDMTAHHQSDPVRYPRTGREAYYMNEGDYLKAQKEAELRGEVVTAVYHSHVGAGPYFSEMDQEFADHELFPFPDAAQIVLALGEKRVVGAALFERDERGQGYRGRLLVASEP